MGNVIDANGNVQFGIVETAAPNSDGTVETSVIVSFIAPATVVASGPGIPLLSLSATIGTGGTISGDQTLYYAVSAVDSTGEESALSFVVTAIIAADGSSVTLTGLSFSAATAAFNVYRGITPANLLRVASGQPIATGFTDRGLVDQLLSPPDPKFDHANFYWRSELQPEVAVTTYSPTMVGNGALQMAVNGYIGMTVRITRGKGAAQERSITANDVTTLTVSPWNVQPDPTSFFYDCRSCMALCRRRTKQPGPVCDSKSSRRSSTDYRPLGEC